MSTGTRWDSIVFAREALLRYPEAYRGELRRINFGENTTFRVSAPSGIYALRLYRPNRWSPEAIVVEHEFMRFLGDALNVSPPIPGSDGATLQHVSNGTCVALFRWVPGRALHRATAPSQVRRIGAFLAQLHDQGRFFSDANLRVRWDQEELLRKSLRTIEGAWSKHLPDFDYDWATRVEVLEELWSELEPEEGFLHGDMHGTNLKVQRGRIFPIDFDDFGFGPLAYEFGVIGYNNIDAPELFEPLLEGYNDQTEGEGVLMEDMHLFTGVRVVFLMAWVLNRTHVFDAEEVEHSAEVNMRCMNLVMRRLGISGLE